jgi:hypothetical protein
MDEEEQENEVFKQADKANIIHSSSTSSFLSSRFWPLQFRLNLKREAAAGQPPSRDNFPIKYLLNMALLNADGRIIDSRRIVTAAQCVDTRPTSWLRIRAGSMQHASNRKLAEAQRLPGI